MQSTALTSQACLVNQDVFLGAVSQLTHYPRLTSRTNKEQCSSYVLEERAMIRTFVEEAAALASIVLFVGMIAVWAQLIPQL